MIKLAQNVFMSKWMIRIGYFNFAIPLYFSVMSGVLWLEGNYPSSLLFFIIGALFLSQALYFSVNAFSRNPSVGKKYAIWQVISLSYFLIIWLWAPIANLIYY